MSELSPVTPKHIEIVDVRWSEQLGPQIFDGTLFSHRTGALVPKSIDILSSCGLSGCLTKNTPPVPGFFLTGVQTVLVTCKCGKQLDVSLDELRARFG